MLIRAAHKIGMVSNFLYPDLPEKRGSCDKSDNWYRYHHLWRVEQSFRMSKYDLEARPI